MKHDVLRLLSTAVVGARKRVSNTSLSYFFATYPAAANCAAMKRRLAAGHRRNWSIAVVLLALVIAPLSYRGLLWT